MHQLLPKEGLDDIYSSLSLEQTRRGFLDDLITASKVTLVGSLLQEDTLLAQEKPKLDEVIEASTRRPCFILVHDPDSKWSTERLSDFKSVGTEYQKQMGFYTAPTSYIPQMQQKNLIRGKVVPSSILAVANCKGLLLGSEDISDVHDFEFTYLRTAHARLEDLKKDALIGDARKAYFREQAQQWKEDTQRLQRQIPQVINSARGTIPFRKNAAFKRTIEYEKLVEDSRIAVMIHSDQFCRYCPRTYGPLVDLADKYTKHNDIGIGVLYGDGQDNDAGRDNVGDNSTAISLHQKKRNVSKGGLPRLVVYVDGTPVYSGNDGGPLMTGLVEAHIARTFGRDYVLQRDKKQN